MSTPDLVGQTMGNYRIESLLGAGGMGQVYRGVHVLLNRPAAVKVMHGHLAADPGFQARFIQEAKTIASLEHPNIVQIYDFGEKDGRFFLVMELITDGSLRTLIQRNPVQPIDLKSGLRLIRQAADALDYAHRRGMVHRDIKPDNLLLQRQSNQRDGQSYILKVTDFGLARLAEGGVMTAAGVTMGTPAYMSPEQAQGDELDGRSDLYSLGVVLFELVTGSLPFDVKTLSDAVQKHIYTAPPAPRQMRADLPVDVEAIILRCLAKRPNERYLTAAELSRALAGALGEGRPVVAGMVAQSGGQPPNRPATPSLPGTMMNQPVPGATPPVVPTLLGGGALPRVHVTEEGGRTVQTVELTRSGLTVGRLPTNDIPLAANDVSRNHLRIDWDGARVTVTDLGSSNGTLLADSRLLPQVAQTWMPGDWLRLGPFWLRLQAPNEPDTKPMPPAQSATSIGSRPAGSAVVSGPPSIQSDRLHITLEQERLTLTPGQPTLLKATLANLGTTVDHLSVAVEGVPASWIKGPEREVQLNPGGQAPVVVNVNVPREPASVAGDYPVAVRVRSRENPAETSSVRTTWTVLPFAASGITLEPARRSAATKARYGVMLRNDGNAQAAYALSGKDDEQVLGYRFQQETVTVEPGTSSRVGLTVEVPRRWVGNAQRKPFTVQSIPAAGGQPQVASGELVHRALIPVWLPPLVLAAALALGFLLRGLLFPPPATPTIDSLTVDPLNPVAGQPFVVRWQVRNADTVEIRPLIAGLDPTAGAYLVESGIPPNVNLTLVATNDDGSSEKPVPLVVVPPTPSPTPEPGAPVIETWTISPMAVQLGEPVTISWSVTDAESVEIEPFGTVDLQGQRQDLPQQTTRYTLIARNRDKIIRRSEQVIVIMPTPSPMPTSGGMPTPMPTSGGMNTPTPMMTPTPAMPVITVEASKTEIEPYECVSLKWNIQHAKSATLDGQSISLQGTRENVCPGMTKTYRWIATAQDNSTIERSLTIGARPWRIEHFAGEWVNMDQHTSGMTRLIIEKKNDLAVIFHGYGKCTPTDCDWDALSTGRPDNVPFTTPKMIGTYNFGYKTTRITVERFGDELQVEVFDDYTPADGRRDTTSFYVMRKKGWDFDPNVEIRLTPFVRQP